MLILTLTGPSRVKVWPRPRMHVMAAEQLGCSTGLRTCANPGGGGVRGNVHPPPLENLNFLILLQLQFIY